MVSWTPQSHAYSGHCKSTRQKYEVCHLGQGQTSKLFAQIFLNKKITQNGSMFSPDLRLSDSPIKSQIPAIASMLGIAIVLYVWILRQHQVSLCVSSSSFFCTSTKYEPHWFDTSEGDFIP